MGYSQQYPSTQFDISNGLPNNTVRSILKASDGVIWIGTDNGVALLKNGQVERYSNSKLPSTRVWQIKQDKAKSIWIGTYGKGIYKIDGNAITHYDKTNGLVHNAVRKLLVKDNTLIVGTDDGVSIIKNDTITNLDIVGNEKRFQIQDFFEYGDEVYVVSYQAGMYKIVNLENKPSLEKIRDYNHTIAIGIAGNSVYQSKDGSTNFYTIEEFINDSLPRKTKPSSIAWDYAPINDSTTYTASWGVHTDNGGVFKIVDDNLSLVNDAFGIQSKAVWTIEYDPQYKILYVGTLDNGLHRVGVSGDLLFQPTKTKVKDVLLTDSLEVVITEKQIKIHNSKNTVSIDAPTLVKFRDKVILKNPKLQTVRNYWLLEKFNEDSIILHSVQHKDGSIWVSTNLGLFEIDELGKTLNYFPVRNEVFSFTPKGNLICPVPYHGVQVFGNANINDEVFFEPKEKSTPVDVSKFITFGDSLFIVSQTRGLFSYDENKFENILRTSGLLSATTNSKGIAFLSHRDGYVLQYNFKHRKILDTLSQNRYKGQSIQFLNYSNDKLFIGTERGVNILTDNTEKLIDSEQGLKDMFVQNASVYGSKMFVGTNSGYYSIDLDNLNITNDSLQLSLKKLEVNFEPRKDFNTNKLLELDHDQNNVSLSFSANHPYPKKLEYAYKLGTGQKWVQLSEPKLLLPFLPSGKYDVKIKTKDWHNGNTTVQTLLTLSIGQPFWKRWQFWLLVTLLMAVLAVIIFRIRLKTIRKHEQQKAEIQQRLVETKLEALQSQMNPHFTFNAMNSIQNYIIDNDVDNALMFLGEFSKLIRLTLEHSTQQKITLAEELSYLKSYVAVENLRFGNGVGFNIEVDDNINVYDVEVIPMALQPFIENCFEHAFTQSTTNPKIELTLSRQNDTMTATILDNGTGIRNLDTQKEFQSKGINLVTERLRLTQGNFKPVHVESTPKIGTTITVTFKI